MFFHARRDKLRKVFIVFLFLSILFLAGCESEVTITFNSNGGTEVTSMSNNSNTSITKPNDPTKNGYTFAGWYTDVELTNEFQFEKMPKTDTTLYAKWNVNQYTITFNSNGGSLVASITADYNSDITKPADPTKTGYSFGGWFVDSSLYVAFVFGKMPSGNVTLHAKWTISENTITFNSNGGSDVNPIIGDYDTAITMPNEPTRLGYTFAGWYSDEQFSTEFVFDKMPENSITLYAKWTPNLYKITFETNGGSNVALLNANCGQNITKPTDPTLDGYSFEGWFVDEDFYEEFVFSTMPPHNLTLYAKWAFAHTPISAFDYTISYAHNEVTINGMKVDNLEEIVIPQFIKGVPVTTLSGTFNHYYSLKSVTLPEGLKVIGNSTFNYCYNLSSINFPDSITHIMKNAFYLCDKLEDITLPASLTDIGESAFGHCYGIKNIVLPEGLKRIDNYAFQHSGLFNSIVFIPSSVTNVGSYVFNAVTGVTIICNFTSKPFNWSNDWDKWELPGDPKFNTYFLGSTDMKIIDGVVYGLFNSSYVILFADKNITSVVIPETIEDYEVTAISKNAFLDCRKLESITLPNSIKIIDDYAFKACMALKEINLPSGLTTIGNYAFDSCFGFSRTAIIIPETVTSVGNYIFNQVPRYLVIGMFSQKPAGWSDDWNKNANGSSNFGVTYFIPSSEFAQTDDFIYLVENNEITIIYAHKNITDLVIPNQIDGKDITIIGPSSFSYCTELKTITLPNNLKIIRNNAFFSCLSLESINLPDSITSIESSAFSGCEKLAEVNIPTLISVIESGVFGGCKALKSIIIPNNITTIGNSAFTRTGLESITIPSSVTGIGNLAFNQCYDLKSIILPANISLGEQVFNFCTSLESITIPNSVTEIKRYMFSGCTSLTTVILPSTLTKIGIGAFSGCTSLTSIIIPISVTEIEQDAFRNCSSLTINCEVSEKPAAWHSDWNYSNRLVVWSYQAN